MGRQTGQGRGSAILALGLATLLATSGCDTDILGSYVYEQTFNLGGTVARGSDGAPVSGATVELGLSSGSRAFYGVLDGNRRAETDDSGVYRIRVRLGFDWWRDAYDVRPCGFSVQATHPDWGRSRPVAVPCTAEEQTIDLSLETAE